MKDVNIMAFVDVEHTGIMTYTTGRSTKKGARRICMNATPDRAQLEDAKKDVLQGQETMNKTIVC